MILGLKNSLKLSMWKQDQFLFFFSQILALKKNGFQAIPKSLEGQSVALIFLEPSTRTRVSFQKALRHLGAEVVIIQDNSSLVKGESLEDTVLTLGAMGIKHFIIRSRGEEIFAISQKYPNLTFINAGSGTTDHPTQGLLDGFTIWETFGSFKDLKIVMLGDLLHSRVARSNLQWMKTFGIVPVVTGPKNWVSGFSQSEVQIQEDINKALDQADVLMTHRVQAERLHLNDEFDEKNYLNLFGLTLERLEKTKERCIVMHPGPINRGIEIATEVADHAKSKILTQVENGVWTRIALLQAMMGETV